MLSTGVFSPREEHANLLAESVEAFNSAPTAKLRPKLIWVGSLPALRGPAPHPGSATASATLDSRARPDDRLGLAVSGVTQRKACPRRSSLCSEAGCSSG